MTADETKMAIVVELANLTAQGILTWSRGEYEDQEILNPNEFILERKPPRYRAVKKINYVCETQGSTFEARCDVGGTILSLRVDGSFLLNKDNSSYVACYPKNPFCHLQEAILGTTKNPMLSSEEILRGLRTLREDSPLGNL